MRQPRILDVLRAVSDVAAGHSEVESWWYAPARRLRLGGELPRTDPEMPSVEVVIEIAPDRSADRNAIAAELSRKLLGRPVTVRLHRGAAEERQLFRLVSDTSRTRRWSPREPGNRGASTTS